MTEPLSRAEIRAKYQHDQNWPIQSFDAEDWAKEFMRLFANKREAIDEALMLGWFANALMRGYDEYRHSGAASPHVSRRDLECLCEIAHQAFHVLDDADGDALRDATMAMRVDKLDAAFTSLTGSEDGDPHELLQSIRALIRDVTPDAGLNAAPPATAGEREACPLCGGDGTDGRYGDDGSPHPCGECNGEGTLPALEAAVWPFLELVAWAKRNGCDLENDVDMIQRTIREGTGDKFGGHLGVQGRDFLALAKAWQARTPPAEAKGLSAEEQATVTRCEYADAMTRSFSRQTVNELLAIITRLTGEPA